MAQPITPKSDEVFNTPELLESILTFLPMKDLLFAQRVSTKFYDTIDQSPTLQEALFFRPTTPVRHGRPTAAEINPLLTHSTTSLLATFNESRIPFALSLNHLEHTTEPTKPFWFAFHSRPNSCTTCIPTAKVTIELISIPFVLQGARDPNTGLRTAIQHRAKFGPASLNDTKVYTAGSWRKMLFTQPPCPAEVLNVTRSHGWYTPPFTCGKPVGLTLGAERFLDGEVASLGEIEERVAVLQGAVPQGCGGLRGVAVAEEMMVGLDVGDVRRGDGGGRVEVLEEVVREEDEQD